VNHSLKICVITLSVLALSLGYANPLSRTSRADNEDHSTPVERITDNSPTPYYPPLRQGGVLFVEDLNDSGFGTGVVPDPVWDGLLTIILGAGNYGWWGPTVTPEEDGPPLDTMLNYELIVWNTYDYWWQNTPALTVNDQNNLGSYMDNGGKVWLIGQDALWSGVPVGWMTVYFHLASANQDYWSFCSLGVNVQGLAEIAGFACFNVSDYASNPFFQDELTPDGTAHGVLEDTDSSKVVGIFYPGAGNWMSAFWALDLRTCTPPDQQESMVYGMLDAFGVLGIQEKPPQEPARRISLSIVPDPIVRHAAISYNTPIASNVKLQVYNKAGQSVITLVDEYKYAGSYTVTWNARDTRGIDVPNGVYFVRLTCGSLACSKNIVVVK
jgi:hypothetical protein